MPLLATTPQLTADAAVSDLTAQLSGTSLAGGVGKAGAETVAVAAKKPRALTARQIARQARQQAFLIEFEKTIDLKRAILTAKTSFNEIREWMITDPEFLRKYDKIRLSWIDSAVDGIEIRALKMALKGDSEMIKFALKSHKPKTYNTQQMKKNVFIDATTTNTTNQQNLIVPSADPLTATAKSAEQLQNAIRERMEVLREKHQQRLSQQQAKQVDGREQDDSNVIEVE